MFNPNFGLDVYLKKIKIRENVLMSVKKVIYYSMDYFSDKKN